ncbi:MAG: DNA translocase FtsK [Amnibacterium sp.]
MLQLTSDPKRTTALLLGGFAAVAVLLYLWWPAGTLVGLVAGLYAVHRIGTAMQRRADAQHWADLQDVTAWLGAEPVVAGAPVAVPAAPAPAPVTAPASAAPIAPALRDEVRDQLSGLKAQLGDDYPDFARAARLVVETQYASAARLKRELHVPYSRARRLLTDLEQQHFVGPATGSLPRQVLMPKDRLPELEEMLPA